MLSYNIELVTNCYLNAVLYSRPLSEITRSSRPQFRSAILSIWFWTSVPSGSTPSRSKIRRWQEYPQNSSSAPNPDRTNRHDLPCSLCDANHNAHPIESSNTEIRGDNKCRMRSSRLRFSSSFDISILTNTILQFGKRRWISSAELMAVMRSGHRS